MVPGRVPPAIERVVRRCLEKKPEARFQSAHDLAFALETVSGVSSGSTAAAPVTASSGRSRPRLATLGAIVAVVLAAIAGVWYSTRPPIANEPARFQQITFRRRDDRQYRPVRA